MNANGSTVMVDLLGSATGNRTGYFDTPNPDPVPNLFSQFEFYGSDGISSNSTGSLNVSDPDGETTSIGASLPYGMTCSYNTPRDVPDAPENLAMICISPGSLAWAYYDVSMLGQNDSNIWGCYYGQFLK